MTNINEAADRALLIRLRDYQQVLGSFARIASETLPLERLLQHAAAQTARVTHIKRAKGPALSP
jgi:hypothetical protein